MRVKEGTWKRKTEKEMRKKEGKKERRKEKEREVIAKSMHKKK